ncbi:MAG: 5-formyltetrahydrofolate cyclo-ligase [Gammaproteobacteria bacterium]|nr:5-formyltetrahydrofolate cyclo-ligase [Gammaproteobacteria bacterium]
MLATCERRLFFCPVIDGCHSPLIPSPLEEGSELRRSLRAQRRALFAAERHEAALTVAYRLAETPDFSKAAVIAGYWACHGELDPAPLLERAWVEGKAIHLPVLVGDALQFAPYWPGVALRRNRFNIPEPEIPQEEWRLPCEMDWVLTPLVAFDTTGTRLGMGGGFYDRSFAFLLDPTWLGHRPRLLGLGYEFQRVAALSRQSWDVPLDAAVTDKNLYRFTNLIGMAEQ